MRLLLVKILVIFLLMCSGFAMAADGDRFIFLSSTIGPIDSGVVSALEDQFEKETGIRVRHVGAGTGAALKIATKCHIDLVMAHAKSLEEKFIADGYGTERIPLMYNDFVIVGPASDPAAIKGEKLATGALKKIMEKKGKFISRGDKSGTNVAEMELWQKANIKLKANGMWFMKRVQKVMWPH